MTTKESVLMQLNRALLCSSIRVSPDQIKVQVIDRVRTLTKSMRPSLDRVELVMPFEEAFSVEIPDDKADKLTCCLDIANYILSYPDQKNV